MPRGPISDETKRKRLMEQAAALLGIETEEVKALVTENVETYEEKIKEVESVIDFFSTKREYHFEVCKGCGQAFTYSFRFQGVKHCSSNCANKTLKQLGLSWNPHKSPQERWGRTVPAVVPPTALQETYNIYVLLKARFDGISPEEFGLETPDTSLVQNE